MIFEIEIDGELVKFRTFFIPDPIHLWWRVR